MHFNDLLDIHNSFTPENSNADILGDGFLLHFNPIYRNIKATALKIGSTYVEAYPEYLLLPFHELPNIVARKQIPYVPGAKLMRKIEDSQPGVFSTDDMPMPESYHLHESAHVIADHYLKPLKIKTQQEEILTAVMAESFANTVDALACAYAADDIHYFFIKQNSYMHPQEKVMQAMAGLTESMGFRFTFMLTYFTYIHANFLTKPIGKKAIAALADKYAPGKKITATTQKNIKTVIDIGEKLDPQFRVTTTANYFKQKGYEGDLHDLLDFPFMEIFASRPEFWKAAEQLSDSIAP